MISLPYCIYRFTWNPCVHVLGIILHHLISKCNSNTQTLNFPTSAPMISNFQSSYFPCTPSLATIIRWLSLCLRPSLQCLLLEVEIFVLPTKVIGWLNFSSSIKRVFVRYFQNQKGFHAYFPKKIIMISFDIAFYESNRYFSGFTQSYFPTSRKLIFLWHLLVKSLL